ncbi:MAG: hypothetical protein WB791_09555 [Waddliaceae bacterium]
MINVTYISDLENITAWLKDLTGQNNDNEEKINDLFIKIKEKFSPDFFEQIKKHLGNLSITEGRNDDDLSRAVARLGGALLATTSKEVKDFGKDLKEISRCNPPLSSDLYSEIISYLSVTDVANLKSVCSYDKKMAFEKGPKVLINTINKKKISLFSAGFKSLQEAINFFGEASIHLKYADLSGFQISDDDCDKLKQFFPNLNYLFIVSNMITNQALSHLRGMPLKSVTFRLSDHLTDEALSHLSGMPLESVDFQWCGQLTDRALSHLSGMPLKSVNFNYCCRLTDKALSHLRKMSLKSVAFQQCYQLTDKALSHLSGMPLESVDFQGCGQLTDEALSHLSGMSLKSVDFQGCHRLTDEALSHLSGMPLESVAFSGCIQLTDKALSHLRGMPLKSVAFQQCYQLTKQALSHLKSTLLK